MAKKCLKPVKMPAFSLGQPCTITHGNYAGRFGIISQDHFTYFLVNVLNSKTEVDQVEVGKEYVVPINDRVLNHILLSFEPNFFVRNRGVSNTNHIHKGHQY